MRVKLFILALSFMAYSPCYAKQIIAISVGGASDREIHVVFTSESKRFGYRLEGRYTTHNAAKIAIARRREAKELRDKINTLVSRNGGDKSNLSLLLVGKSAGAIQIWNVFKRHYGDFDDFHRVALVFIDPHGAAYDDGEFGPYKDSQDLWWPSNWSSDRDFFRVYNVYQRREGLTGASFPDHRVFQNTQISKSRITHTNIPEHLQTREIIQSAFNFACMPRAEEGVTKPFEISIQNLVGINTVNGRQPIVFNLNNFTCDCSGSRVYVFKDSMPIRTFKNIKVGQNVTFRPTARGRKLYFQAYRGSGLFRLIVEKTIFLDYEPPTFNSIKVTPNTRRERSMVLFADRVRDDGYWNTSDYQVQVTLDGTQDYSGSGTGITLNNLSDGRHSATMRISDGLGRWSDTRSTYFTMSAGPPNLSFVRPSRNAHVARGHDLTITIEASATGGIMRVAVYLDRVSEDEFNPTMLCYFRGTFGDGRAENRTCTVRADWSRGRHAIIAVATDNSGLTRRVERNFYVD